MCDPVNLYKRGNGSEDRVSSVAGKKFQIWQARPHASRIEGSHAIEVRVFVECDQCNKEHFHRGYRSKLSE